MSLLPFISNGARRLVYPTIFVNSVAGSDANSGASPAQAFATIAAAQAVVASGSVVGLSRGGYWREQFNITANNIAVVNYGSGAMPVIDGADIVTTGWTQPDAITYPNVWSRSWTRASATTTASEMLGYWEAGVRPRFASSLADLQTNGGWFTTSLTTQTSTVSIKSTADPNGDGILREITKRHYGIQGHTNTLLSTKTGQRVFGPIEIKRCVGHYNALSMGQGSARQMFLRDGNIHHMVSEGEKVDDILATEYSPAIAPSVFVGYRDAGTGFNPVFTRLLALMPGGASRVTGSNSAFYGHSALAQGVSSFTVDAGMSRGLNFANASAQRLTLKNCYCEDPYDYFMGSTSALTEVFRALIKETVASANGTGISILSKSLTTTTFTAESVASYSLKGAAVRNVTGGTKPIIRDCAIVTGGSAIGMSGGEYDLAYSILYSAGRPMDAITNLHVADYNVLYFIGQTNPIIQYNGNLYSSGTTAFQSYVAASGQDQNSVYLKAADQTSGNALAFWLGIAQGGAGPSNGDFRINPACRVYDKNNTALIGLFGDGVTPITRAGPQVHWDYNLRAIVAGPPTKFPTLPATIAEMRTYLEDPTAWNFYP